MEILQFIVGSALFAAFGFIISQLTEERPSWLIEKDRFDKKLKGRWSWLHPIVGALSFTYNCLALGFFGLIKCIEWVSALIKWLKYWVWDRAFLWVWREVIVTPIVLIAKVCWYYLVSMPWEIVKQSLRTIPGSWSWSVVKACWKGMFVALASYGLVATIAEGLDIPELRYIGGLIALAPITWTVAMAVSLHNGSKSENDHSAYARNAAMRFVKYSSALIAALLAAVLFIQSGNIESIGIPLFGLLINASHVLFSLAVFIGLILTFSLSIFPVQGPSESPSLGLVEEAKGLVVEVRNNGAKYLFGAAVGLAMACIVVALPAALMVMARESAGAIQEQLPLTEANVKRPAIDAGVSDQDWMSQVDSAVSAAGMQVQIELLREFPDQGIFEPQVALSDSGIVWVEEWHTELKSSLLTEKGAFEATAADLEAKITDLKAAIALEQLEGSTFALQRKSSKEEDWQTIGENIATLGFMDSNLSPDATYTYRVQARNAAGESSWSYPIVVNTPAITLAAPSALQATAQSNFRVVLRWNDNSWNEDAFVLERSVDKKEWTELARLESDQSGYIDSSPLDTTQYYRISAINGTDTSKAYDMASATPLLSKPSFRSNEATFDAAVVEWYHTSKYTDAKGSGRVTANVRPTVAYDDISVIQFLMNKLEEAETELATLNTAWTAKETSMNQRIAHLEPLVGKACVSSTMRFLNCILSWIAIALLWGFVAAFGASYAGKQLMVLGGIGQAEGFYFIDRVQEARAANNNQPLMGLLLLPVLLLMLSGNIDVNSILSDFQHTAQELEEVGEVLEDYAEEPVAE